MFNGGRVLDSINQDASILFELHPRRDEVVSVGGSNKSRLLYSFTVVSTERMVTGCREVFLMTIHYIQKVTGAYQFVNVIYKPVD
jgi:hypothetical protein